MFFKDVKRWEWGGEGVVKRGLWFVWICDFKKCDLKK